MFGLRLKMHMKDDIIMPNSELQHSLRINIMGWLDKAKNVASQAKDKISDVDTDALKQRAKDVSNNAVSSVSDKAVEAVSTTKELVSNVDAKQVLADVKANAGEFTEKGQALASEQIQKSSKAISGVYSEQVDNIKSQATNATEYLKSGPAKLNAMARSTLEIDKDTMRMVSDLQGRLPVPANTMDDIFTQCRDVAIQRAMASFFLTGTMEAIDRNSEAKYENLSESYKDYTARTNIRDHENYSEMKNIRADARDTFNFVEDGYNKGNQTSPYDVDIEHVISAKEIYGSTIVKAGTNDDQLLDVVNDKDNLIFTNSSVNRSKGQVPLAEVLERSEPHPTKEGVRVLTTNGETHEISEADCQEALERSEESLDSHKVEAAKEIGLTAVKTGAAMAVQQVIGMMVVETIDIFMEELQRFCKDFKLFDEKGIIGNVQELQQRLFQKLNQRFEERQIWAKARTLGIEAGVSGALSVIPQILISMITKMPAFVLGMIREGTLSCVRSVRVLAGNDPNKLQSISIIMASTASAVVGLYVSRVISTGLAGVPLLNRFNSQITSILSGLLVTAVPLVAIYTFDQNKKRLMFAINKDKSTPLFESAQS